MQSEELPVQKPRDSAWGATGSRAVPAQGMRLTVVPLGARAPLTPDAAIQLSQGPHPRDIGNPGHQVSGFEVKGGFLVGQVVDFDLLGKGVVSAQLA